MKFEGSKIADWKISTQGFNGFRPAWPSLSFLFFDVLIGYTTNCKPVALVSTKAKWWGTV